MRGTPIVLLSVACLGFAGCDSPEADIAEPTSAEPADPSLHASGTDGAALGEPFADLTAEDLARFAAGLEEFSEVEEVDEGLGPVFNEASCALCHAGPVGGTNGRLETRFGRLEGDFGRRGSGTRVFDPLAELGGSLIQDQGIGPVDGGVTFVGETVPGRANVVARRLTTPLFGLGLVDAVPDAAFERLAQLQALRTPRTRGTLSRVIEVGTGQPRIGRFGWKAQVPTLHVFAGDAYLNEMGITNPLFPEENCPQGDCALLEHNPLPTLNDNGEGVDAFTDFMTLLAPPPRGRRTREVEEGSRIFEDIGCADCHTPQLTTGDSPVTALRNRTFQPYSDFLLHDMGRLGDGIVQGSAKGREMRTAPLWGARSRSLFLHDGRATTVSGAILAHDGQGQQARDRFARLERLKRNKLLAFLNSL